MALEAQDIDTCAAMDVNADADVTVDELVRAVA